MSCFKYRNINVPLSPFLQISKFVIFYIGSDVSNVTVTTDSEDNDVHQLHSSLNDGFSSEKYFCIYHIHVYAWKIASIFVSRFAKNICFAACVPSIKFLVNIRPIARKEDEWEEKKGTEGKFPCCSFVYLCVSEIELFWTTEWIKRRYFRLQKFRATNTDSFLRQSSFIGFVKWCFACKIVPTSKKPCLDRVPNIRKFNCAISLCDKIVCFYPASIKGAVCLYTNAVTN